VNDTAGQRRRTGGPWRLLGVAVFAASLLFLGIVASRHARELAGLPWRELGYAPLLAALAAYLATIALLGAGWHLWLRAVGQPSTLRQAVAVTAIAQLAKYLPGNVGHWVGRVTMSAHRGVTVLAAVYALALENLWALVACSLFLLLSWSSLAIPDLAPRPGNPLLVLLLLALGLVTAQGMPWLLRNLPAGLRHRVGLRQDLAVPGVRVSLAGLLLYLSSWLVNGLALLAVIHAGFAQLTPGWIWAGAIYATAWLSGYLLPGAPGGLGAREAVLVLLLEPTLGTAAALGVAVLLRAVTLAGDLLAFIAGWLLAGTGAHTLSRS